SDASSRAIPIAALSGSAPRDAHILARGASADGMKRSPVVWIRAAGSGSEASVLLRDLWRGAIGADRDALASFWARLVVWLAQRSRFPPGARIALEIPEPAWAVGREGTIVVRARDSETARGLALRIIAPDASRSPAALAPIAGEENAWQARVAPSEAGIHRADLIAADGSSLASEPFAVAGPPGEDALVAADRAALERLSAASGGRTVEARDLPALLSEIEDALRPADALPVTHDLGDRPILLVAIAALLAAEWILRRRGGLP
ncbi:MAG: hypothetical protein JXP34_05970, partial [Planctomycetes bacterium]|nr:hypothetical protein [Planctomycetota bacterium]